MYIKRIKTVFFVSIFFYMLFSFNNVYAKYSYSINENIIKLTRNTRVANYVVNYSEKTEYVNTNITVLVTFDKEIDYLDGFTKKDNYTFEKIYSQNVNETRVFEDYSGNKGSINVVIKNIDKEKPKIIGIENKSNLTAPLKLSYSDNTEIYKVDIEKYGSSLNYSTLEFFYDTDAYYGLDVLDTSIKVKIIEKPLNTKKFKYYINGTLKAITDNINYTYKNLTPMTDYDVKVEAIDSSGKVLGSKSRTITTHCFKSFTNNKTDHISFITINGITEKAEKIKVAIWNGYDEENKVWVDAIYDKSTRKLEFAFDSSTFPYRNDKNTYRIHFHFTDANDNVFYIFASNIKFGVTAEEDEDIIVDDVYKITSSGKYRITVEDLAGNITEELIVVK